MNGDNVTYFNSSGAEHIPNEIKNFIDRKNIIISIYITQSYDSIMCGYFYIRFIDFTLKVKKFVTVYQLIVTVYQRIWKEWKINIKILSIDSKKVKMWFEIGIENLKTIKYHMF